jgi:hypothetical protein
MKQLPNYSELAYVKYPLYSITRKAKLFDCKNYFLLQFEPIQIIKEELKTIKLKHITYNNILKMTFNKYTY